MSTPVNHLCPHAYRKVGDVSIHCRKQPEERCNFCGHQYFCSTTNRWEVSSQSRDCPLRKEDRK